MLLQRIQIVVLDLRYDIVEDLLVREEPCRHESIEDRGVTKRIKCVLTERTVIHGRLLVRVCHTNLLTPVVEDETSEGNWEKQGHSWSIEKGNENHVEDVR